MLVLRNIYQYIMEFYMSSKLYINSIIQNNLIMKQEEYMNTTIIIGENAQDNWDIIDFESDYIWLHLNSFPSCHIIINDVNIDDNVLLYAAQLCKHNTKYKNLTQ